MDDWIARVATPGPWLVWSKSQLAGFSLIAGIFDAYWDAYNPTNEQYAKLDLPILTITGMYDDAQRSG